MGVRVKRGSRRDRDQALLALVGREGEAAFEAGVPLSGNPYPDGGGMAFSGRYARWILGWRRGEWQTERAAYEARRLRDEERAASRRELRWGSEGAR